MRILLLAFLQGVILSVPQVAYAMKYDELNLKKPASGRGVSAQQVAAAIDGKSQPRKVRGKLFRAVNAALQQKKQSPIADFKLLFEGSVMKKGKKPKEAAAAGGAPKK